MTVRVQRLPIAADPLIAEANRRTRTRRVWLAFAVLASVGIAAGLTTALRAPSERSTSSARVSWRGWRHGGGDVVVRRNGTGLEHFALGAWMVFTVRFRVVGVTRKDAVTVARIRLTWVQITAPSGKRRISNSPGKRVPYRGELDTLRLTRGVITDTLTGGIYCSVTAPRSLCNPGP
jgi:hypothetical protein